MIDVKWERERESGVLASCNDTMLFWYNFRGLMFNYFLSLWDIKYKYSIENWRFSTYIILVRDIHVTRKR